MSSEVIKATITLNNIKQHVYSVSDYKLCPEESEIVQDALRFYIEAKKMDKLSVPEIFASIDKSIKTFDDATKDLQLFDLKI